MSFPPARPPFVREQVQADVRVRAVVRERYQVSVEGNNLESEKKCGLWKKLLAGFGVLPAGVNDHDEFVPLGAVSDRQLDLTQWEVTRT